MLGNISWDVIIMGAPITFPPLSPPPPPPPPPLQQQQQQQQLPGSDSSTSSLGTVVEALLRAFKAARGSGLGSEDSSSSAVVSGGDG